MGHSIHSMPRPIRRRLKRTVQRAHDRDVVRRAMALLHLAAGCTVSETAERVCAARSTVQRWRDLYLEYGEAGLAPAVRGRSPWTVTEALIASLAELLEHTPEAYGYLRSTWSSELLSLELHRQHAMEIHPSTVRRVLPQMGYVWRRSRPVLVRRDGRVEMVRLLIARGADVNWIDGERVTPLILASFKNHETIVRMLIAEKADRTVRDKWDRSALDYALRRGEDDPIAVLLRK